MGKQREAKFENIEQMGHLCSVGVTRVEKYLMDDKKISSSAIRCALRDGDIGTANAMLGYTYSITGVVQHGIQAGRSIGFPTANIAVEYGQKLVPKTGGYAVRVMVNEREYGGMFNVGSRTTLNHPDTISLEAHIFDFDGNIYGKNITISLVKRLRDELQFASLNALKQQLVKDAQSAKKLLTTFFA